MQLLCIIVDARVGFQDAAYLGVSCFKPTTITTLFYMCECFACMDVYIQHGTWCLCSKRSKEGIIVPATEAVDVCELPCGCRESRRRSSARASAPDC